MNKIYKVSVKITGFGFGHSEGAYEEMTKYMTPQKVFILRITNEVNSKSQTTVITVFM